MERPAEQAGIPSPSSWVERSLSWSTAGVLEFDYGVDSRFASAIDDYIDNLYSLTRRHSHCGYVSSIQHECGRRINRVWHSLTVYWSGELQ
jgi:hypothetical protein